MCVLCLLRIPIVFAGETTSAPGDLCVLWVYIFLCKITSVSRNLDWIEKENTTIKTNEEEDNCVGSAKNWPRGAYKNVFTFLNENVHMRVLRSKLQKKTENSGINKSSWWLKGKKIGHRTVQCYLFSRYDWAIHSMFDSCVYKDRAVTELFSENEEDALEMNLIYWHKYLNETSVYHHFRTHLCTQYVSIAQITAKYWPTQFIYTVQHSNPIHIELWNEQKENK